MVSRPSSDSSRRVFGVYASGVDDAVDDGTLTLYCVADSSREAIAWMAQWLVMPRAFTVMDVEAFQRMVAALYDMVDKDDWTKVLSVAGITYFVDEVTLKELEALNQAQT